MMKEVVLFDLDGTLMDSMSMVIKCFEYLFQKYRTVEEFTRDKQVEVFGPPLAVEMAKFFPEKDPEELVEEYRAYQENMKANQDVFLMPHALEVLQGYKREGARMGIVSSRLTVSCEHWLKEFGVRDLFEVVLGREAFEHPKPAPDGILLACKQMHVDPENCVYIGDNASDVLAAKAAGCSSVGFVSTPEKEQEIQDSKPDLLIHDLKELSAVTK